jgi:hypothetical protein
MVSPGSKTYLPWSWTRQVRIAAQRRLMLVIYTVLFLALLIAILVEFHWTRLLLLLATGGGALTQVHLIRSGASRSQ